MSIPISDIDNDDDDDDRDPVEALADEFVARHRRGERPDVEDYAARCPDRASEIRDLFPAVAAMERWKPDPSTARRGRNLVLGFGPGPARERLGEYRIIREIGRGGMGIVYEAEQESLGRRVAIKVLPGVNDADDRPLRRFLREGRTAAGLRHGHIVPVFASGQDDGLHYYVMPLIVGFGLDRVLAALRGSRDENRPGPAGELAEVVRAWGFDGPPTADPGPAYWRGVARVGFQVAGALQHAHEQGILHRDIKPGNILIDATGSAWVTDFGLAKATCHDDLSRTGDLVGTLRYLAPERFQGRCDPRSDLYSLGLTLDELATLRPADQPPGTSPGRSLAVPRDLAAAIHRAIEPNSTLRQASAGDLADDLARFLDGRPPRARHATGAGRLALWASGNRAVATLAGTSLVLALVAAFFIGLFLTAPPHPRPGEPPPMFGDRPPPRPRLFPPPPPPPPGHWPPERFDDGPPP